VSICCPSLEPEFSNQIAQNLQAPSFGVYLLARSATKSTQPLLLKPENGFHSQIPNNFIHNPLHTQPQPKPYQTPKPPNTFTSAHATTIHHQMELQISSTQTWERKNKN
jgi:hypothetical protein